MADKKHIVIVGAGFGGIKLAQELQEEKVRITIVDRFNFHLFQPLLYQVSTAMLAPDEIAYPIRTFFRDAKNVEFFMAKAEGVDRERNVLLTSHGELEYDYLVLAAGATTNYFGNDSVEKNAYGMKTLQEAQSIRNHILHEFERANKKHEYDEKERRQKLTFVIVGGGPTGVEMAGAIIELVDLLKTEYHNLDFKQVSVKLLEAMDSVLPMMPKELQHKTVEVLRDKGVEVILGANVTGYDGKVLSLNDGTDIPTSTVIWAAGVKAVDFIKNCGGEVDRAGRIIVEENLLVKGSKNIFAIGDCANFQHGSLERPLPTVAPVATQQAVVAKKNIMRLIKGKEQLKEFFYEDLGAMATIGRGEAVLSGPMPVLGINMKMSGFPAWCAWMIVHLQRLVGWQMNINVALKWTWNLISGTRLGRIITNMTID